MQRLVLVACLLLLPLLGGCAHNYYNLPQESVAEKIKVLGLVPLIIDTESDIRHPQKDELVTLLINVNRSFERDLLRVMKNSNNFYAVTLLDADPRAVFSNLVYRREQRDDAAIQYNKYFWKEDALREFARKNSVDALMFVVVGGMNRADKVSSSNLLDSVSTDYNFLIMTAQIVDPQGTIIWEYPNFRQRSLSYRPLLNLQYPDFDEAKANLSPSVELKFKTIDGIRRALEKRRLDILRRETAEVDIYMTQFEEMVSVMNITKEGRRAPPPEASGNSDRPQEK